jgi:hypothetical protein
VLVGCDRQIERAQPRIGHPTTRAHRSEHSDRVIAFAGGSNARREVESPAAYKAEPARERNDAIWQKGSRVPVKRGRHSQDRSPAAHADVIATIGPERTASGVQSGQPPRVPHHVSEVIERQHAVVTTVEVHEFAGRIERQAARIDDPRIATERPDQFALGIEAEKRVVAPAPAPALVTRRRATPAVTATRATPTVRGTLPPLRGVRDAGHRRTHLRHNQPDPTDPTPVTGPCWWRVGRAKVRLQRDQPLPPLLAFPSVL